LYFLDISRSSNKDCIRDYVILRPIAIKNGTRIEWIKRIKSQNPF